MTKTLTGVALRWWRITGADREGDLVEKDSIWDGGRTFNGQAHRREETLCRIGDNVAWIKFADRNNGVGRLARRKVKQIFQSSRGERQKGFVILIG